MFSAVLIANLIIVDLKNFTFYAIENGNVVKIGQASGGRRYCPDIKRGCKTPIGRFKMIVKRGEHYRSPIYPIGCTGYSGPKKCAPMYWYVKFVEAGAGFHGAKDNWKHPKHQSHSCIHTTIEDAKWLHDWINKDTVIEVLPY